MSNLELNHLFDENKELKRRNKSLEAKLENYDKRWKERYLVDNPFAEYYKNLETKVEKLKSLMLLTDPVVSDVVVSDTQIKQHQEYLRCFEDERKALKKIEDVK